MPNDIVHQTLCNEIRDRNPGIDGSALRDRDAALADIGIDSLLVVDLIMVFAERHDADLETVLDGVTPPRTMGDFVSLLSGFQKAA